MAKFLDPCSWQLDSCGLFIAAHILTLLQGWVLADCVSDVLFTDIEYSPEFSLPIGKVCNFFSDRIGTCLFFRSGGKVRCLTMKGLKRSGATDARLRISSRFNGIDRQSLLTNMV